MSMPVADWKTNPPDLKNHTPPTQSAPESLDLVLKHAGASLHRDAVDHRVIENVRQRKGRLIDSQGEVGGWPNLRSTMPPADKDRDGISDAWEKAHGLDSNNAADHNADRAGDGYTNLEEYINSLSQTAFAK